MPRYLPFREEEAAARAKAVKGIVRWAALRLPAHHADAAPDPNELDTESTVCGIAAEPTGCRDCPFPINSGACENCELDKIDESQPTGELFKYWFDMRVYRPPIVADVGERYDHLHLPFSARNDRGARLSAELQLAKWAR
ncbi:hypothetical protein HY972_02615 [Candidatus Kaiserbacteria bacterium]|nr:hypothetical protein [Candidatus Kaiserbacteria bacterium]